MAKKKVNVALIGTKFMGKAHSNAFRQVSRFFDLNVEPVMKVICGQDPEGTKDAAANFGWEEFDTDWKRVVNRPDIDIVDISSPGYMHAAMAIEAAKAGKHIICEKPLANSLKEAKAMAAAVKKAGVNNLCGYTYRFNPAIQTIKAMIGRGDLGEIFHVRACYLQDWIVDPEFPVNWRLQKKYSGTGSLGDIGAHIIDMAQYLVGEIGEVSAAMQTFIKERPVIEGQATIAAKATKKSAKKGVVDVDDGVIVLARFKGANTLGTFEATRFAPGKRNQNCIEIYGSKGSVIFNQEDMHKFQYYNIADPPHLQGFRSIHATDGAHPYAANWWPSAHLIGYEHLFTHEVYEFIQQLGKKKVTYPTFEDGLRCQMVLDAVEKAAAKKKWVTVK
ncbi:MAG: Gfo/Idh/MocA family oxidoreductase [Candidatus Hydrogenedentes bacterium]|nr:Gfo/Idh/MocA family oxidoreductase [Candidatus Hydrogenedentota bacterium]